jgi:DNA-binding NarL/FixJ family response regulator
MIRIAVIDDHPALRAGLRTVIDAEPGLVFVGESAGDEESVWPLLRRTEPDLILLDYHLPHGDGLA